MDYDSLTIALKSSTDLATSQEILDSWLIKIDNPPSRFSVIQELLLIAPCRSTLQLAESCLDSGKDKQLCFPMLLALLELELPESNNILARWLATNLHVQYIHLVLIESLGHNTEYFLPVVQNWISNNLQHESLPIIFITILTSTTDQVTFEWVWKWINIHPENSFIGSILHELLIANSVTDYVFGNDLVRYAKEWLRANPLSNNAGGILGALVSANADDAQFTREWLREYGAEPIAAEVWFALISQENENQMEAGVHNWLESNSAHPLSARIAAKLGSKSDGN